MSRKRLTTATLQGRDKKATKGQALVELSNTLKIAARYVDDLIQGMDKKAANDIYDLNVTAPRGQNDPQLGYVDQSAGGGVTDEQIELMTGVKDISKKDVDDAQPKETVYASREK